MTFVAAVSSEKNVVRQNFDKNEKTEVNIETKKSS